MAHLPLAHTDDELFHAYFAPKITEDQIIDFIKNLRGNGKYYYVAAIIAKALRPTSCPECLEKLVETLIKYGLMAGLPENAFTKTDNLIHKYPSLFYGKDWRDLRDLSRENRMCELKPRFSQNTMKMVEQYKISRKKNFVSSLLIPELAEIIYSQIDEKEAEYADPDKVCDDYDDWDHPRILQLVEWVYFKVIKNAHLRKHEVKLKTNFKSIAQSMYILSRVPHFFTTEILESSRKKIKFALETGHTLKSLKEMAEYDPFRNVHDDPREMAAAKNQIWQIINELGRKYNNISFSLYMYKFGLDFDARPRKLSPWENFVDQQVKQTHAELRAESIRNRTGSHVTPYLLLDKLKSKWDALSPEEQERYQ